MLLKVAEVQSRESVWNSSAKRDEMWWNEIKQSTYDKCVLIVVFNDKIHPRYEGRKSSDPLTS